MVVVLWALMSLIVAFAPPRHTAEAVFLLAVFAGMVFLTLYVFVTRATIRDGTLTLHALRRRERLRAPLDAVVGYHMDKETGAWWVHTRPEGTACTEPAARTRVALVEPWELHRAFVDLAPKKLGGRKRRFPGVPPEEDFVGLWTFDVERFAGRALPQLAGMFTGIAIVALLTPHRHPGLILQPLSLLLVPALLAWDRLDVTRAGIVRRGPFGRRTVLWPEVRAIFRETRHGRRSFVVVGRDAAIHLPPHLAVDRDLIEKVLYSLPDPVLTVNFDETTLRGYRRREKKRSKAPARQEDLLPALTASAPLRRSERFRSCADRSGRARS